jgi:hypothetical protein
MVLVMFSNCSTIYCSFLSVCTLCNTLQDRLFASFYQWLRLNLFCGRRFSSSCLFFLVRFGVFVRFFGRIDVVVFWLERIVDDRFEVGKCGLRCML